MDDSVLEKVGVLVRYFSSSVHYSVDVLFLFLSRSEAILQRQQCMAGMYVLYGKSVCQDLNIQNWFISRKHPDGLKQ